MEVKKLYYTMGEVAEMFDVNTSLIRYWEQHFSIIKPERNKKGNRLFTPADVENFKKIYYLVKERGMTLEGAKKSLRGAADINRDVELMDRLLKVRSLLEEVRQELKYDDEEEESQSVEVQSVAIDSEVAPVQEPESLEPVKQMRTSAPDGEDKELFAFYEQKLF